MKVQKIQFNIQSTCNYLCKLCFEQEFLNGPKSSTKCQVFCLKLLRLCVERLNSKKEVALCLSIGFLCTHNLFKTNGTSENIVKLAFEKILLHFSKACLVNKRFTECKKAISLLYTQLLKTLESWSEEEPTLLQHSYEILSEASIRAKESLTPEKVLDLKQQALKCLLSSKQDNFRLVLEKTQAADLLYNKAIREKSKSVSDLNIKTLYNFYRGVLKIEQYLKKGLSCQLFVPVCQYALVVVKVCVMAEKKEEGAEILACVGRLVGGHRCKECVQGDIEALRCQILAIRLWKAMETGNWLR